MEDEEAVNAGQQSRYRDSRKQGREGKRNIVQEDTGEKHQEHDQDAGDHRDSPGLIEGLVPDQPHDDGCRGESQDVQDHRPVHDDAVQHLHVFLGNVHGFPVGQRTCVAPHILEQMEDHHAAA